VRPAFITHIGEEEDAEEELDASEAQFGAALNACDFGFVDLGLGHFLRKEGVRKE